MRVAHISIRDISGTRIFRIGTDGSLTRAKNVLISSKGPGNYKFTVFQEEPFLKDNQVSVDGIRLMVKVPSDRPFDPVLDVMSTPITIIAKMTVEHELVFSVTGYWLLDNFECNIEDFMREVYDPLREEIGPSLADKIDFEVSFRKGLFNLYNTHYPKLFQLGQDITEELAQYASLYRVCKLMESPHMSWVLNDIVKFAGVVHLSDWFHSLCNLVNVDKRAHDPASYLRLSRPVYKYFISRPTWIRPWVLQELESRTRALLITLIDTIEKFNKRSEEIIVENALKGSFTTSVFHIPEDFLFDLLFEIVSLKGSNSKLALDKMIRFVIRRLNDRKVENLIATIELNLEIFKYQERLGLAYQPNLNYEQANYFVTQLLYRIEVQEYLENNPDTNERLSKLARLSSHLNWTKGDYSVVIPENCQEFIKEGEAQGNCVSTYIEQVVEGKSTIVFLRRHNRSFITIEIKSESVFQALGKNNEELTPEQDQIVREFAKEKGIDYWEPIPRRAEVPDQDIDEDFWIDPDLDLDDLV